jgi:hypothetical protein
MILQLPYGILGRRRLESEAEEKREGELSEKRGEKGV